MSPHDPLQWLREDLQDLKEDVQGIRGDVQDGLNEARIERRALSDAQDAHGRQIGRLFSEVRKLSEAPPPPSFLPACGTDTCSLKAHLEAHQSASWVASMPALAWKFCASMWSYRRGIAYTLGTLAAIGGVIAGAYWPELGDRLRTLGGLMR